jgi:hypothetical protein
MSAGRFAARSSGPRGYAAAIETDLISRLRSLPVGPRADSLFKSDLRSQLVSITARIVAESASEASIAAAHGARAAAKDSRAGAQVGVRGVLGALRRPVLAFASAAAVLVLLLGMAVWISGSSLPGDSLYGVKRASENFQLSLAGNDTEKGRTYLDLARNRVTEAAKLLGKPDAMAAGPGFVATGGVSAHTSKLVTEALASADSDSRSGMQLLGKAAVANMSADPLQKLTGWLPAQQSRMTEVLNRIPAGALHNRAKSSLDLLSRVSARADALKANIGCPCLALVVSDDLGPVPCSPCDPLVASQPGQQPGGSVTPTIPGVVPTPPSHSGSQLPGSSPRGSGTLVPGATGSGASGGRLPGSVTSGAPLPAVPGLPLPGVTTSSGGLGVTLVPGVSIGAGTGGVSASQPLLP